MSITASPWWRRISTPTSSRRGRPRLLGPDDPLRVGTTLTARVAVQLWDQVLSRCLDVAARDLKRDGEGFYTISSAGHEQNAIVGAQLRTSDPTFLHYRSGAFMASRLRQVDDGTPLFDTLLSFCAAKDDPVSSGRHKVWGSKETWVPPQTSTIASHVPKAVGAAYCSGAPPSGSTQGPRGRDHLLHLWRRERQPRHRALGPTRRATPGGANPPRCSSSARTSAGISVETPRR